MSQSESATSALLAIETAGMSGSLALWRDGSQIRATSLPNGRRTLETLAPALRDLVREAGLAMADLGCIAVVVGPGSFTGLRIGVTTAKTLAFALDARVIGIDTMRVLAAQVETSRPRLWTIIDAQREQLYAARFDPQPDGEPVLVEPTSIVDIESWLASRTAADCITGPALSKLAAQLPADVEVAPGYHWEPQAATLARLAWSDWQAGRTNDLWSLAPQYHRLSAAEEKWLAKGNRPQ